MSTMTTRPRPACSTWPPPDADPTAQWDENEQAGPLGSWADGWFEERFRSALVRELGRDAPEARFAGVITLVRSLLGESAGNAAEVEAASRRVLVSLFPDWPPRPPDGFKVNGVEPKGRKGLLFWFELLFATPFPAFSSKLNAWVTWWAGQWLMGPCTIEDLPSEKEEYGGKVVVGDGTNQQLLVRRCRFLEEAGCASVCVNACKMPTQAFFNKEMGVPMRMVPDYETLECRFQFGIEPTREDEADARNAPCFAACPLGGQSSRASNPLPCEAMGGEDDDDDAEEVVREWLERGWPQSEPVL